MMLRSASRPAAVMPSVPNGTSTAASGRPTTGTLAISISAIEYMMTSAVNANAWRRYRANPSRNQAHPAAAGSVLTCMARILSARRHAAAATHGNVASAMRCARMRSKWVGSCGVRTSAGRGR